MIEIFKAECNFVVVSAHLALESVQAGFPSPAENYLDKTLDLNEPFDSPIPLPLFLSGLPVIRW